MTIEEWVAYAKELGFSEAAPVVPADLKPNAEVRAMCAADKCHAYGKNWTCPPECGSLEECAARISAKTRGILVQSVAQLEALCMSMHGLNFINAFLLIIFLIIFFFQNILPH